MKEAYGVPNAQPILDGPDWYTLADGGDGYYYYWNQHCSGTVRIELTLACSFFLVEYQYRLKATILIQAQAYRIAY